MQQLDIRGVLTPDYSAIWTSEAQDFVASLARRYAPRVDELLQRRTKRQAEFNAGVMPDFLPETAGVRNGIWQTAPIPYDLQDRRVEITGPVDRKMIINALNSGAKVFMADFEDSSAPTWDAMVEGQINLRDAVRGTITYTSPDGRAYKLNDKTAVLMVRPRGWHLPEKHVLYEGKAIPSALMDFGLYFFHNLEALRNKHTAPYFYLPKMESHLEARLWNDVFLYAQERLEVPKGTIRATVLIETLPAAFEMDEILYELRDHSAGLNCGRWDYIFNFIKCFRTNPNFVLPERGQVTMTTHFLRSYSKLLIKTCHKRGIHAMGGMAAQIPNKDDPVANDIAMTKVRADKDRESTDGHDGTWVGHPGLVHIAIEVFDKHMLGPNQIHHKHEDTVVTAQDLLTVPQGTITIGGLVNNIAVSLRYLEAWLRGQGCVPLYYLMEDAATAEISRTQLWQWIRYPKGVLDDGRRITIEMVREILDHDMAGIRRELSETYKTRKFEEAARILDHLIASDDVANFLTLEAYKELS